MTEAWIPRDAELGTDEPDAPARHEHVPAELVQGDLAQELNRRVRQIDGVTDLYNARPPARAALATVATLLTGRAVEPVVVDSSGDGLTVTVSLMVSESRPAADTCRRVFDVVHDLVTTHAPGDTLCAVRIRVSRIG